MNALDTADRQDVAAVALYGGPERFGAGADIREMTAMSPADMTLWARHLQDAFTAVADIPEPVVAAVNGFALGGGCELALTADHRIRPTTPASASPRFCSDPPTGKR